jgi:transposase
MAAVPLRQDIISEDLRRAARYERDGRVCARMFAIANALDGMSREAAARQAGMDRQTLRDWVIRFNAEGVEGLRDRPRSGRRPHLAEGQQAALKAVVLAGPDRERDGIVTWRIEDIRDLAERRYGARYSVSGMHRLLKSLDLSWMTARPQHPEADLAAQEAFKKSSRR